MELHKNTANAFIQYLKQHGYPDDNIVTEWGDQQHRIDIAILDENRNFPVAIYEVKGRKDKRTIENGISQLKKYQKFIGYPTETGLVFPMDEAPYFKFYNTNEYMGMANYKTFKERQFDASRVDKDEVKPYRSVSNSAEPKIKVQQRKRKEKYLDWLKIVSWGIMCPLIIVLLILELLNLYEFTTERLVVLGVLLLIIVLPFYKEISFKGVTVKKDDGKQR